MANIYKLLPIFSLLLVFSYGCASSPETAQEESSPSIWQSTKRFYREYVNTPAKVDLGADGPCKDYEVCLGGAIASVDLQLRDLQKVMDNSDRAPDTHWVESTMRRFPWLSGLALTDENGKVVAKFPEVSMKEFTIDGLQEVPEGRRPMELRTTVADSPLGKEVYLAKPVYTEGAFRGLVVAHFDMRVLMSNTKDSDIFMVTSPFGVLWEGAYAPGSTPLDGQDWKKLAASDHKGTVSSGGNTFYWTSTYFGNMPLVYALPTTGGFLGKNAPSTELKKPEETGAPEAKPADAKPAEANAAEKPADAKAEGQPEAEKKAEPESKAEEAKAQNNDTASNKQPEPAK